MIKFQNDYGKFEFQLGSFYDVDMIDLKSGETYPHTCIEVIGETKDKIKTTQNKDLVLLEKKVICHAELSVDY